MRRLLYTILFLALSAGMVGAAPVSARIKDIARVDGVRDNPLQGFGLVVGLDNTGDNNSPVLNQMLWDFSRHSQLKFPLADLRAKNVAAVVVTANLPPFARGGSRFDVQVSSIGNAKSLQGGTLLSTPLEGADGEVHALAAGPLSIGGFNAQGGGARVTKNHPTVGRIPGGAVVEGDMVPTSVAKDGRILLVLSDPDFTTAKNAADSINQVLGVSAMARPLDMRTIEVNVAPVAQKYAGREVELIAEIERIPVLTDESARVVVDERTGTVVVGQNVRISTVAVSHSNFVVEINTETRGAIGATYYGDILAVTEEKTLLSAREITAGSDTIQIFRENVTINDLVKTINSVNMSPRDLISILQAMQAAGALKAELVVW
ncbi:flagellar basal body P-ring protein FlgI [bacterium]|nr:flagellar basal body P-ring protein FlgI [bacterium]